MSQGHRFRGPGRHKNHTYENQPPQQIRRPIPAGDYEIMSTSLAVTDAKVSSEPGDAISSTLNAGYMEPSYTDRQSAYIHDSHTNGKKG